MVVPLHNRLFGLDILRALAVLMIVEGHSFGRIFINSKAGIFDGVNLFFVLSGFLIGSILIKYLSDNFSKRKLLEFWIKRWFRTLPAYFFVLFSLCLNSKYFTTGEPILSHIKEFFFLQNFFVWKWQTSIFPESWSLCIEEWFYLLTPITFYFLKNIFKFSTKATLLTTIVSIIILDTFLRIHRGSHISDFNAWNILIRQPAIFRFDSLMFGVLGAYFNHYNLWKNKKVLFVTGIFIWIASLISFYIPFNTFFNYFLIPLQSVGTLFLIPYLCTLKSNDKIIGRFISYVATISYSLYLVNLTPYSMLLNRLYHYIHISNFWIIIGCPIISFICAHIIYILIERPFMNMRQPIVAWLNSSITNRLTDNQIIILEAEKSKGEVPV